jgi:AraC-like DNA-binding protein
MEIEGRGGRVAGSTMAMVPAGDVHSFAAAGENAFLVLDIGDRAALPSCAPFVPMHPDLSALCRAATPHLEGAGKPDLQRHFCALFLAVLADTTAAAPVPASIRRALDMLHRRYAEPLAVADVASASGLGQSRLQERFRTVTGCSVHAYLMRLRAQAAMRLLAESDLPLAEIALATGHGDQSALSRNLRRHAGLSPAAYRRSQRAGESA